MRIGVSTSTAMVDTGLAALFLTAAVVEAIAIAQSWGLTYWLLGGAAATIVCVLALARRRSRAGFAAAGLVIAAGSVLTSGVLHLPAEPGPAMALGLAVLTGSAVRSETTARAAAVAGGGLAVVICSQIAAGPWGAGPAPVTWLNILIWIAGTGTGVALRLTDSRARSNSARIRAEERLELARELHDMVAHHITGMVLQTQATQLLARRGSERVPERLAVIEAAGAEALTAMRRVVGLLRDTEDGPPVESEPEELSVLVERFGRQRGPVRLHTPANLAEWPPAVTTTVYRIVRESLTNISKHAPPSAAVSVAVEQTDEITVMIDNDGPTSPTRRMPRGGYGLVGMRERVEGLGGTLQAGPRPSGGWSVKATLPYSPREQR
ncbi:sensor histidine kinase [Salinispora vitiensis]|uniref:sensor histidine kinase n=1 Tax=Salinispora vitiensis TaxID=999544 RepID=UPI00039E6068|nr:histidine kinase [Salinispora vitiensis]